MQVQAAHERGPGEPGEDEEEGGRKHGLERGGAGGQSLREDGPGGGGKGAGQAEQAREQSGKEEGQRTGERPLQAPSQGKAAATGAGEAVDEDEQGREQEGGDEQPQRPRGEQLTLDGQRGFNPTPNRAGGAQVGVGIERIDGAEHSAGEVLQAGRADGLARGGGQFAADLDEHRGDAVGDERALLAGGEGQREVGELGERGGSAGINSYLTCERGGDGALKRAGSAAQGSREGHEERLVSGGAGEVAEHERSVDRPTGVGGEIERAGVTAAAAAGGDDDDGTCGLAGGEHARELEQRGGAREFGGGAAAGGVAMGEEHDGAGAGDAGAPGDDGGERALAVDGLGLHMAGVDGKAGGARAAQPPQRLGDVGGEGLIALAARPALREAGGEALQLGEGGGPAEGIGRQGGGERASGRPQ